MTIRKNILSNYVGMGVVALAPILALPWYLAALGPKQFGLIGFITMLQAILGLLDAGMSQALVREFSVRLSLADGGRRSTALLPVRIRAHILGVCFLHRRCHAVTGRYDCQALAIVSASDA